MSIVLSTRSGAEIITSKAGSQGVPYHIILVECKKMTCILHSNWVQSPYIGYYTNVTDTSYPRVGSWTADTVIDVDISSYPNAKGIEFQTGTGGGQANSYLQLEILSITK